MVNGSSPSLVCRQSESLQPRVNSISLMTFAGDPAAIVCAGRSRVTTELAPMTQRSPIVTPVVTTTFAPNQQLSPIRVGPFVVNPCHGTGLSGSSKRCDASETKQPLANMQWSPISTNSCAATITPMLRNVPAPILILPLSPVVNQTPGSSSVPSPTSSRPSRNDSRTLP